MHIRIHTCGAIAALLLAASGCAISPEEEQRQKDMEADIDEILSYELDPAEVGEVRNCLSEMESSNYRALGSRHLLFEGRQGKLWVNVLRGRCPGLDKDSIFIMKPNAGARLCDGDTFSVVDRINSLSQARMAPSCILGEFKPVTEAQVKEIENRLESR